MLNLKVINFGSANIDYVYSLEHIVLPGETLTSDKIEVFPGGKGLNQSIALARAGVSVYHAGLIGKDGDFLAETMADAGVNTCYIKRVGEKNGHAIIQVGSDGENSIFLYGGSNLMVTEKYVDDVLSHADKSDILLLQNEINGIGYIIDAAYNKGMCIVLNPSPINEMIQDIDFRKLSYLILNEIEAREISGRDTVDECLEYFKAVYPDLKIMLTLGNKGCIYADKNQRISQRIFEVTAVDSTAAGDTFTGYFVSCITQGKDLSDTLRTASAAAALSVSKKGASVSIPKQSEVESFLSGK